MPSTPRTDLAEGAWLGPQHLVNRQRFSQPFDLHWFQSLHIEHTAQVAVGVVRDQHPTWRCQFLHAGGQIDRLSGHHEFLASRSRVASTMPGAHPHPHLQRKAGFTNPL